MRKLPRRNIRCINSASRRPGTKKRRGTFNLLNTVPQSANDIGFHTLNGGARRKAARRSTPIDRRY
jgi:hypothetical protein